MQTGWGDLEAGARLGVGVSGARSDDEVAAGLGVGGQPVQDAVIGGVVRGGHKDGDGRCGAGRVVLEQLGGVEEAGLQAGVENAPLERLHERRIGVGPASVTVGQRTEPGESPFARVVVQQPHLRVRD